MEERINVMKVALSGLAGVLTNVWGWMGWLAILWAICVLVDYFSGSAAAMRTGTWSSDVFRDGAWHKAGSLLVVMVAGLCDLVLYLVLGHIPGMELPFEYKCMLLPVVLVWYIVGELGSIAENAAAMGAPVPKWLVGMLASVQETVDKAGEQAAGEDEAKTTGLPEWMGKAKVINQLPLTA